MDSENDPLTVLGEAEEADESRLSGSVEASADDLLMTMCQSPPEVLAYSANGPLTALAEAEESRPSDSVASSADDLLTTMCQSTTTSPEDSENRPLTVLGDADEAEECRPSGPSATL